MLIDFFNNYNDDVKQSNFTISAGNIFLVDRKYIKTRNSNDIIEKRTFLAFNNEIDRLLLGCSEILLGDLAEFLIKKEMIDAVTLDGGGSSTLNVEGINVFGGTRKVANALLLE